jgi:TatD DNase family protein
MNFIDTHCHLDGEEFAADRDAVVQRAREAGCEKIFLPAIDLKTCQTVLDVCAQYPGYCYPMLGLHPEEVRADWREVLSSIRQKLPLPISHLKVLSLRVWRCNGVWHAMERAGGEASIIAIGEVGLDFYWSREFEAEQLLAFEEQVRWSVETRLPLMIHCRKAQNELVTILKRYAHDLPGGVFHCFTGNEQEACQLLEFPQFVLGIGGVLTFKKSHLPETLAAVVPLDRIVLETDAPYMAPVPQRGQRNESAFIRYVITRLAEAYGVSEEEICQQTTANVARVFKC